MHCCTWVGNKKKLFFAAILDLNYRRKQDTNDLLLQFNFSPKQPKKAFLLPGHNINFLVCWPTLLVFQKKLSLWLSRDNIGYSHLFLKA